MRRSLWKLVLVLFLLGCGVQPDELPVGFVNHTRHSDADLWTIWKGAQETLTQQVDLNPLQRSLSGVPADIPGDARALKVMPHQLWVGAEPDVSSRALLAATGLERPDPTGMIACPKPCNVRYAAAYSVYSGDVTQYAASWEDQGDSFTFVLEYEFENQNHGRTGLQLEVAVNGWQWQHERACPSEVEGTLAPISVTSILRPGKGRREFECSRRHIPWRPLKS